MRSYFTLFLMAAAVLAFIVPPSVNGAFHNRKIFVSKWAGQKKTLPQLKEVREHIRDEAIHNLRSLPAEVKTALVKAAEETFTKEKYPVKTATEYMEYFRDGNRGHYEGKVTAHQRRIAALVVGNLLDQSTSTKYVDEIVNGVWSLLEESTWCWPAHLGLQGTSDHLAAPGHLAIDLGAGEIAKFLGWVELLMGDKFDHVSPVINKRIDAELKTRIFEGYLKTNYGWEGMGGSHSVNNWNIWVNGNILKSAIFTLHDTALFDAVLNKTLYSADYFLDGYGEDGGCDEGPAYWRQAGGRLIEFLDSLEALFPGASKDYFSSMKLLKSIGEYSYKMHIRDNWFVNFADSVPLLTYPPSLIAMYGKMFNDESMKEYSAYMWKLVTQTKTVHGYFVGELSDLNEFLNVVNWHGEITKAKAAVPELDLVWMPDIQVLVSRSKATSTSKLFLAAKAGSNHESHNHNDVGSLVLYQNGAPVLIDVGVGTYTAKTFSSHRYELFYMQSAYHNTPTINGVQQKAGNSFESHGVSFKEAPNAESVTLTADISGAYPKECHAKHWIRSITFDRKGNSVTLDENYELTTFTKPQQLHFMLASETVVEKSSSGLRLSNSKTGVKMAMDFELAVFSHAEEIKSLEGDHHLTQVWGESVKRLTLTTVPSYKNLSGHFTIKFHETK